LLASTLLLVLSTAIATTTAAITALLSRGVATAAAAILGAPVASAAAVAAVTTAAIATLTSSVTATATAATITTAAITTAATAATAAGATVRSLVNTNYATIELNVVHVLHGSVGLGVLGVPNKPESAAAASVAVLDDDCLFDLAELLELRAQSAVIGVPSKAANEELRHVDERTLDNLTQFAHSTQTERTVR
jgi:hypothetical protein